MVTIFALLVGLFVGWKLGRKYQDFSDLMLARRIAKMVEQRDTVAKDREDFERWERQDRRHRKARGIPDPEDEEEGSA
jgi:hypothetical protein